VLPLLAVHNTVRLRFDIEEAEYLHLAKTDASFPMAHFAMLADTARNEVRARTPDHVSGPQFWHELMHH
jgi:protein arginine N-methyltransferase 7